MRKSIRAVLSGFCALVCASGLVACYSKSDNDATEEPPHECVYNKQVVSDAYLKSRATCVQKAVYYYSCECGEKGSETFENGVANGHTPKSAARENESSSTCEHAGSYDEVVRCNVCNDVISTEHKTIEKKPHTYTQEVVAPAHLASAADCMDKARYYYSCSCGANGSATFEHGALGDHAYANGICTVCGDDIRTATQGLEYRLDAAGTGYICFGIGTATDVDIKIADVYGEDNLPVTKIRSMAFRGTKLTSLTIPIGVTSIDEYAFDDCPNLVIYCEAASKPSGWDERWNRFEYPVVWDCKNNSRDENGYIYTTVGGIRYKLKDDKASVCRQSSIISGDIILPSSVTYRKQQYSVSTIDSYAFSDCGNISSVTIPVGVTAVGRSLFSNCKGLVIYCEADADSKPNGCEAEWRGNYNGIVCPVIWDYKNNDKDENGFAYVKVGGVLYKLKDGTALITTQPKCVSGDLSIASEVTYKGQTYGVAEIEGSAFYACDKLTGIVIPDGINIVTNRSFTFCYALTYAVIPESVTSIEIWAFGNTALNRIYYKGTEAEWDSITIETSNAPVGSAQRYYYSETEPTLNSGGTAYDGNYWHYDNDGKTPTVWVYE